MDGPELVKLISKSMPGADISTILNKTTEILNKRSIVELKKKTFKSVFDLVKIEDNQAVLEMVTNDLFFPENLRNELRNFIDSGLINSFSEFIKKPKRWWSRGR
jgi:hypothetical protein